MQYCPECGEKVAEVDTFCSYCGISLKPMIEQQSDVSMAETIVTPPVILANKVELQAEAETGTNQSVIEEAQLKSEIPAPDLPPPSILSMPEGKSEEQFDETVSPIFRTSENLSIKTESVNVPAELLGQKSEELSLPETEIVGAQSLELTAVSEETPAHTQAESEDFSEIPVPAIIQKLEAEQKILTPLEVSKDFSPEDKSTLSSRFSDKVEDEKSAVPVSPLETPKSAVSGADISGIQNPAANVAGIPAELRLSDESSGENSGLQISERDTSVSVATEKNDFISESPIVPGQILKEFPVETSFASSAEQFGEHKPLSEKDLPEQPAVVEDKAEKSELQPKDSIHGDTEGRKAAKLKPLDEGTILNNRYEIVRKIGGGGMGAVYLALDRNLGGTKRAVKEMVQCYIEADQHEKAISDFQREAMILSELDHPSIPTIYDYFLDEAEGRFYLVMKYISGGDLAGRLRAAPTGRLDEKTVTEWAIQIADVLDYLHRRDPIIVYRDLKPANIMIDDKTGRVMLIDFGIARSINKEERGVTAVGTMGYAPPELFSGNVEPRSDIYSLGSTMFHLLTGADPQSNPLLIFDFQKNPRPRQINPSLSDQIEQIIMKAVEYNAEMRFASAAEMRDALETHLKNLQAGNVTFGINTAPSSVAFSEQVVFCGFCGKQIVASDAYCAFCGAQQPISSQSFQNPSFAVSKGTAKLFVLGTGEFQSSGFSLDKEENLIGRRDPMSNIFPEIDLSKYDPQTKISRRHARIWRQGNQFMLEDLGSSNGTVLLVGLNEKIRLLPRQPHPLNNGDKIKVGDTTLQFITG